MEVYEGEFVAVRADTEYNFVWVREACAFDYKFMDGRVHVVGMDSTSERRSFQIGYVKTHKRTLNDEIFKYREFASNTVEVDDHMCVHIDEYVVLSPISEVSHKYANNMLSVVIVFHPTFPKRFRDARVCIENCYFEIHKDLTDNNVRRVSMFIVQGAGPVVLLIKGKDILLRHTLEL